MPERVCAPDAGLGAVLYQEHGIGHDVVKVLGDCVAVPHQFPVVPRYALVHVQVLRKFPVVASLHIRHQLLQTGKLVFDLLGL